MKFFLQYLVSPILVVALGLVFNAKLEEQRQQLQQIQLAQTMLSTLFSDDYYKSLATKRLLDELLLDPLRGEMDGIVQEYFSKRANEAIATGDVSVADDIVRAAKIVGGASGKAIVNAVEGNDSNKEALTRYEDARAKELAGYRALAANDFNGAMKSFDEAAKVYPDLHSVAEVGSLLSANKAQINDPVVQQKIREQVAQQYSWKVPQDIVQRLKTSR